MIHWVILPKKRDQLSFPHLEKTWIGNYCSFNRRVSKAVADHHDGAITKLEEISVGKDTMTGHWKLCRLEHQKTFSGIPKRLFPEELLKQIERFFWAKSCL